MHRLLDDLGSTALRRVIANQIDRCEASAIEAIHQRESDALFLSAVRGDGLEGLQQWLREQFFDLGAESPQLRPATRRHGRADQRSSEPQALITLAVLALAVVLFITGVIAPELTGLLSLSLLIATGVLNPQEALAGFGVLH